MKYELTVSLKPMMYKFSAQEQFKMTKELMLEIFKKHQASVVCELTKEHNVHYHCIIDFKSIIDKDRFLNRFRGYKQFGRKSCDQVRFENSYKEYMAKSIEELRPLLGDTVLTDYYHVQKSIFDQTDSTMPLLTNLPII